MRICVFCGSSLGRREDYAAGAKALGRALAARGVGLVYGGAGVGLMGVLADTVLEGGGKVIGVLPVALAEVEIAHEGLTELRVVPSMHERKRQMADLSDAFIALPGGAGTLEETFEIWTWTQLSLHAKPVGLLNIAGYYDGLNGFLDHVEKEGFLKPAHRGVLQSDADPERLIDKLLAAEIPKERKWVHAPGR